MARLPGVPDTVLVAPDSFKGTFSASAVAAALARGLARAQVPFDLCPLADGGEGTTEALAQALGAQWREAAVSDPLGRPIRARYARHGTTAILECAAASGLALLAERERDAVRASTRGTGELILAAAAAEGTRRILLGVGGSATTDGGAGAIDAIHEAGGLDGVQLVVLCDVRTPFEAAARVFAPQKGADSDQVEVLCARLAKLAAAMRRDPRGVAMTGAAGGLAGGLWSELGAELVAGAPYVLEAVGFDRRMRASRAVLTGEGRLDEQSLAGKLVAEVATRARQTGVPCHAAVGRCQLDAFGLRILDLQQVLEASDLEALEQAGRELGELIRLPV